MDLSTRRDRLSRARLYLVCDATPGGRPLADVLVPALRGGVDLFQLRMKGADDAAVLAAAAVAREACAAAGALFILNDRPELVAAAGADGAHVGQDDLPLARARELAGGDRLIGQSTHSPAQVDAGAGADYLGVGPVHATPTKPGRPAVGTDLVAYAAAHATVPFFAIGGLDGTTVGAALAAGATRVAIVRAIAEASDPEAAARALRAQVDAIALSEPDPEASRGAVA
jgi:thiamine-phosphate pyrophosphorylase